MNIDDILSNASFLWSPGVFAIVAALAVLFIWIAVAPSSAKRDQDGRLNRYRQNRDIIEETELSRPFWSRAITPFLRKSLKAFARLTPRSNIERLQTTLMHAGEPGGLTPTDILGLQILCAIIPAALYLLVLWSTGQLTRSPWMFVARNGAVLAVLGYLTPRIWLLMLVDQRKRELISTFSDALDLLSISVEAGLGFDSALVKVCEQWHNALTKEFNRSVLEMRVGTPRNIALQRMADRTGVQEIQTFIGVLIQSNELGVSIAEVLHTQAVEVRLRRRQRAQELGQQASIKMIFALVFLIFPALLVVLLGPGIPRIFESLKIMSGG
ncbi:MAG: type II secretion system F family protein [Anaerolineales bacterium]|nr:MAG: type II secretion system F family protein [Anaerolineales bacterium]